MRSQLLKISKESTKIERRISELFKKNKIKFRFRQKIGPYEADFLVGKMIFEIDGKIHNKIKIERDTYFVENGFIPIHLKITKETDMEKVGESIKELIFSNTWKM
jgi:very-short-patch-repair endonuclease